MDAKEYWKLKHKKYDLEDWATKPTIFAKFAINYFPEKGRLLELGAGLGQDSHYFAQKGYEVTSTDFSEVALETSKHKTAEDKIDVDFRLVDLQHTIPFKKNSFDIVYSHLAIQFFSRKRTVAVFNEITSIIRPDGILALMLNTIDDPEVSKSEKIEDGLYKTPSGLIKRFYSTKDIENLTKNKFETLVLDNKGETYKDQIKTLVRFIGKRI